MGGMDTAIVVFAAILKEPSGLFWYLEKLQLLEAHAHGGKRNPEFSS